MITFEKTDNKDFGELKILWQTCFDEDKRAIDLFFEKAMHFTDAYCAKSDGMIVSALYLMKASLNSRKAHYMFGVATLPKYRGKGIMRNLIEYALSDAKQSGDVYSLLLPANEKLYDFYAKFGYVAKCTSGVAESSRREFRESITTEKCDFQHLQKECFGDDFLLQNNNFFEFAKDYYRIYGVKAVQNKSAFALIEENENLAEIFYSAYTDFEQLVDLVLANTTAQKLVFTVKSDNTDFNNIKTDKFGMIKSLDDTEIPDDVYIGITLS